MIDAPPSSPEPVQAVDAATVLLLRPGSSDRGLEVLLLERARTTAAFGGAFVYPGGKVTSGDRSIDPSLVRCADPELRAEQLRTETVEEAVGFLVAAIRETFEESGILLASRQGGEPITDADLASPSFQAARDRLATRGREWDWHEWLDEHRLVLELDDLQPWAWWVTPVDRPRRFDTRFFVVRVPVAQTAIHDGDETTSLRWLTAEAALDGERRGQLHLRPATIKTLTALRPFTSIDGVLETARRSGLGHAPRTSPPGTASAAESGTSPAADEKSVDTTTSPEESR